LLSQPLDHSIEIYFDYSRNTVDKVLYFYNIRIMNIDDIATRLEALGNPTRLRIYQILVRAGENGMSVGRLQDKLSIAASTLSHHLQKLVLVGLATQERQSTTLICRANYPMLREVVGSLIDQCCADVTPPSSIADTRSCTPKTA
jgi:ArsR family transcriptional regulator, arsenate/arsenite/antimonite-responsive transcriptional repressor